MHTQTITTMPRKLHRGPLKRRVGFVCLFVFCLFEQLLKQLKQIYQEFVSDRGVAAQGGASTSRRVLVTSLRHMLGLVVNVRNLLKGQGKLKVNFRYGALPNCSAL